MSKAKFTLGQWKSGGFQSYDAFTGEPVRYVYRTGDSSPDANTRVAVTGDNCDADARLIAASPDLYAACEASLAEFEATGYGESVGYGFFCGGDPRCFTPDEDSTQEEREQWRKDCEAYAKGEIGPVESAGRSYRNDEGVLISHVQLSGYGLGSYTYRDPSVGHSTHG